MNGQSRAETRSLPESYYSRLEKKGREQAQAAIDKATARFQQRGGHQSLIESEIIPGRPKEVILDEAERWGADLIVLGSHGLKGLGRFLLGSVSQAVATHAQCSVEIVRGPATGEERETP